MLLQTWGLELQVQGAPNYLGAIHKASEITHKTLWLLVAMICTHVGFSHINNKWLSSQSQKVNNQSYRPQSIQGTCTVIN